MVRGPYRLSRWYEVSVLAKVYQALDVVFRCRNPASVVGNPEGEGEAAPAEVVLVVAFLYSLGSAPGI